MTQATALYELYKHLPKKERRAFKSLIENEEETSLKDQIREGLREIKAIREGKAEARDFDELLNEMRNEHKTESPLAF